MAVVQGVVNKLMSRPWNDKTFHSFKINGDDRIFNTGTRKIRGIAEGKFVAFEVEKNQKGYWDVDGKTVEVKDPPANTPQADPTKQYKPDNEYWATKDKIIELQACRNTAIELTKVLLDKEAVKIPAKADKYQIITELVNKLTQEFVSANQAIREGKAVPQGPAEGPATEEKYEEPTESEEDSFWEEE